MDDLMLRGRGRGVGREGSRGDKVREEGKGRERKRD